MDPVDADTIAENANAPLSATVDGQTAQQVPIPDQIAAANYAAGVDAVAGTGDNGGPKSPFNCLRNARFRPGGSC